MPAVSRASWIAAAWRSNACFLITAPMKFEKSSTSPTLICSMFAQSSSRIALQTDCGTYARDGGEHLGLGRLPHDGVAHDRGRGRQVAADRREVERRQREHEALERPQLLHVPHAGAAVRLHLVELVRVADVPPPEVDHLAGGVDL